MHGLPHHTSPALPPNQKNKQLAYPLRTNSAAASERGSQTLHCSLLIWQKDLLAKRKEKKKPAGPTNDFFLVDKNQTFPHQPLAGTVPGNANSCGMKEGVRQ